ncbi:fungal specific transcription factor domain-containing protein [Aspergillus brunneoviolaceus CBS 621.78]|uniref:C2H2 finger domain protein n=1 Tax=Aspergillus brunneoviolaceus CBS 621.78 TaxID=1450534 RepID=A0ACD1G0U2_9EURO|nr:C2H2 finger domain protein [Aspergillus brunneoviolaceus CBS 621.78]RAH42860.1 C2H2 finger domain protein [Aspergillus brunneoviolaceus CBS 621.78]
MKSASSKHFCCTICQRGFTRIDHLKRHHLRLITSATTTRIATSAETRRSRKRGRGAGDDMPASRQKRNLPCNNERKKQTNGLELGTGAKSNNRGDYVGTSDRGSISFLLNGGSDSFTEEFRLPPCSDRSRGMKYHTQMGLKEARSTMLDYQMGLDQLDIAPAFIEADPTARSFFHDNFLDFFNGPFEGPPKFMGTSQYSTGSEFSAGLPPGQSSVTHPSEQPYVPEQPYAAALSQAILSRAWAVSLDANAKQRLAANASFLLTTARIQKFVWMYARYWHPSCAMVHLASLQLNTVPLPLLAGLVFMGAMYSNDEQETYAAKQLLDFVELYIFSTEVFSPESDIASMFCKGKTNFPHEGDDWVQFLNFQAGFIICIVQYWSGSRMSHNRAMENRFSEITKKVARRMNLTKCRHQHPDVTSEQQWIQTECRIRTISIISLLDCAFCFFQNYPCRLSHVEMDCDFPCQEALFNLEHPYTDIGFHYSRGFTIKEAFQSLFDGSNAPNMSFPLSPDSSTNPSGILPNMNILDMFILIHLLYAFIDTYMTLASVTRSNQPQIQSPPQPTQLSDPASPDKFRSQIAPENSVLGSIRVALARWREHWLTLQSAVSNHEWASMGFYKNGYNFWLVCHLLITRKESMDVVMGLEVKCEDKLEKLKVLLNDDKD